MKAVAIIKALGPIDAKSVGRDALLRWMVVLPLSVALAMRWVVPPIVARLETAFQVELTPYYPTLVGTALLLLSPAMTGMVVGFLLLDERDDRTLTALLVTPLSANGYLAYRLALPTLLSLLVTVMAFPLADLTPAGFLALLMAAVAAAPQAPLFALFLAAFAQNKVQGFALMKAAGVLLIPPWVAYFTPSGWQVAFGVIPTYWPAKVFWQLQAGGDYGSYLIVGLVYQALLLAMLTRRFDKAMHE